MNKFKRYVVPIILTMVVSASIYSYENGKSIENKNNTNEVKIEKVYSNSESKAEKLNPKEKMINDKNKIKESTPFKIEVPNIDLGDLKEVKQFLRIVDYSYDAPTTNKTPTSDHKLTTVYKGNKTRALVILQTEDTGKPHKLLDECEKVKVKGVDAYIYDPQPGIGRSVVQVMFWKDGKYYNVAGSDLSKGDLLKIAESLR
jgi:hypothetical protein